MVGSLTSWRGSQSASTAGALAAATLAMASALVPARSVPGLRVRPLLRPSAGAMRSADREPEWRVLTEPEWRARAEAHRERVRALLAPGFLAKRERGDSGGDDGFWGLDGDNPIYNFLLRYYNIRGAAGTRRLARWSPGAHVVLEGGGWPPVPVPIWRPRGVRWFAQKP